MPVAKTISPATDFSYPAAWPSNTVPSSRMSFAFFIALFNQQVPPHWGGSSDIFLATLELEKRSLLGFLRSIFYIRIFCILLFLCFVAAFRLRFYLFNF